MEGEEAIYTAIATLVLVILTYMMYRSAVNPKWIALSKKEKEEWKKGKK
jgi:hypothetical protein